MAMSCASILYICKRQLLHRNTTNDIYIHFAEQKLSPLATAGERRTEGRRDCLSSYLHYRANMVSIRFAID